MIKTIVSLTLSIMMLTSNGQSPSKNERKSYTHEFIAKIEKIDTVSLVSKSFLDSTIIPSQHFKAICIKIKILSRMVGDFNEKVDRILIELKESDQGCIYNFREKKQYRIFAYTASYSSEAVKKEFRTKHFRLDCYNLPVLFP